MLLDNMSVEQLTQAVAMVGSRAITEASGRVTADCTGDCRDRRRSYLCRMDHAQRANPRYRAGLPVAHATFN